MPLPKKLKEILGPLNLIPHPEGGFFVETFRSGCEPMTTMGQTGFDCDKPSINLVVANERSKNRPDGDERRNAMSSIFWAPTVNLPRLLLAINTSDHVHYYHGGISGLYYLFDPSNKEFSTVTLGPNIHKGEKLQIAVEGGIWKCGMLINDESDDDGYDYSLIGEAVAPGFDFHDFKWVTENDIHCNIEDEGVKAHFKEFLFKDSTKIVAEAKTVEAAKAFYTDDEIRKARIAEHEGHK